MLVFPCFPSSAPKGFDTLCRPEFAKLLPFRSTFIGQTSGITGRNEMDR